TIMQLVAALLLLVASTVTQVLAQLPVPAPTRPSKAVVEESLGLPANLTRFRTLIARGRTYYSCNLINPDTAAWIPTTISAPLYLTARRIQVGTYNANLSIPEHVWEHTADGSQVFGAEIATSVDHTSGNDLPYALYNATEVIADSPTDYFAKTAFLIRTYTKNGRVNPRARCDLDKVGRVRDQRFAAHYWFYRPAITVQPTNPTDETTASEPEIITA
ncbi:hypothetical protein BC831DRAFT_465006, partial [Entophlyctis helioformis]